MPSELVAQLESWKSRFDSQAARRLERLLERILHSRFSGAKDHIRLHETLLFLRAYPLTGKVAKLADEILFSFAARLATEVDLDAFEDPEVSGIAGTSLTAVFSHEVASRLAELDRNHVEIAWDRYDEQERLGPVLRKILPLLREDWPVEAHVPFSQWVGAAHPRSMSDLEWVLAHVRQPDLYDSMQVPLTWRMGTSRYSRSRLRLPVRRLYTHCEPLLRRSDISLADVLAGPPLRVRRLARPESNRILDMIVATSAMRYRELYGFSHPERSAVYHAAAGRGVDIFFFGVPPEHRLPLRAYHCGLFFKNGVPAGYVELLSLVERAEVGFNLYYTFREGESAWLYSRLLRLFHQVLGVTCFSVDPYQLGHENAEAVDSGAFWFYRKLGFRPTDPEAIRLTAREETRMQKTPGYRSSRRTLEKLADGYMLYEIPGTESGDWDRFRVRTLAVRLARGGDEERRVTQALARMKKTGAETRYLRWTQANRELREKLIQWGNVSG